MISVARGVLALAIATALWMATSVATATDVEVRGAVAEQHECVVDGSSGCRLEIPEVPAAQSQEAEFEEVEAEHAEPPASEPPPEAVLNDQAPDVPEPALEEFDDVVVEPVESILEDGHAPDSPDQPAPRS